MKDNKNLVKEEKKFIKTKQKANGGIEVEITKNPNKTKTGRFFAILIAVLTIAVPVASLIYLLVLFAK